MPWLTAGTLHGRLLAQRIHQGRDVPPVVGGQFVDAGDQDLALRIVLGILLGSRAGRFVVVVVQSSGRGGGGPDDGNRQVQSQARPFSVTGRGGRPRFLVVASVYTVDRGRPPRLATSP
jgi:hypothetical protein